MLGSLTGVNGITSNKVSQNGSPPHVCQHRRVNYRVTQSVTEIFPIRQIHAQVNKAEMAAARYSTDVLQETSEPRADGLLSRAKEWLTTRADGTSQEQKSG